MNLNYEQIKEISSSYGDAFYLLDSAQFCCNYEALLKAYKTYYTNTCISYSYKTNYIPKLCKAVNDLGGYAEVVSHMEYELAKKIGVDPSRIIFNGPLKYEYAVRELALAGGLINLDHADEAQLILQIARENKTKEIRVAMRVNFDIGRDISRFGFDVSSKEFGQILHLLLKEENLKVEGFHCHFSPRDMQSWENRIRELDKFLEEKVPFVPAYLSLGGGLFGKMAPSLQAQFDVEIPTYQDYAKIVGTYFSDRYGKSGSTKPRLFMEPGSALAGDCMGFVAKVANIKAVRGKSIATVLGSIYNINPTLNGKNPPIRIISDSSGQEQCYEALDIAGYTCIETDYLYKGYCGPLKVGDYILFQNVGSYSIVLKPPFIMPNFPVVEVNEQRKEIELIKAAETVDDIFHGFVF